MTWVDAADMMYSTGLEQYPDSVFLHIAYANFLSTYKKGSGVRLQSGLHSSFADGQPHTCDMLVHTALT